MKQHGSSKGKARSAVLDFFMNIGIHNTTSGILILFEVIHYPVNGMNKMGINKKKKSEYSRVKIGTQK